MTDEILRPQRRPIPQQGTQSPPTQRTPEENLAMLEQMQQMHNNIEEKPMPMGGNPLSGANPLNRVVADMPPEVQQQLTAARAQQIAAQNPQDNWIADTPPQRPQQPQLQPHPQQQTPQSWLTDTSNLQKPGGGAHDPSPSPMARRPGPRNHQRSTPVKINASPALDALLGKISEKTAIYETIELPSKGIFYNGEDGPRNGILHVRRMTGEEEQVLATQRLVRKGDAINQIFRRCMQEQYDPAWLLTADRTYMLIYLRGISYTPRYDVEINCPVCRSKFSHPLNLDEMWVDDCPLDFTPDSLHGVLPTTGANYKYRLSRGYDEQDLQEYRQRRNQLPEDDESTDDTLTFRTGQLLEEIEGVTDKQELAFAVSKLPSSDTNHLMNTVNNPPFGADTEVTIECRVCGNGFSVDMPMESGFFFPRQKRGSRTRATS